MMYVSPLVRIWSSYPPEFVPEAFNQPLNKRNVSKVKDMESMFEGASSFNQPLNKWNVSNVTRMAMQATVLRFQGNRSLRGARRLYVYVVKTYDICET